MGLRLPTQIFTSLQFIASNSALPSGHRLSSNSADSSRNLRKEIPALKNIQIGMKRSVKQIIKEPACIPLGMHPKISFTNI